jgi:hypothetical protein
MAGYAAEEVPRASAAAAHHSGRKGRSGNDDFNRQLRREADQGNLSSCIELLETGADVHAADGGGKVALHYAARGGHEAIVDRLILFEANVNKQDKYGGRALDEAEYWYTKARGNPKLFDRMDSYKAVIELLVKNGARRSAPGDEGHETRARQYERLCQEKDLETGSYVQPPWLAPALLALGNGELNGVAQPARVADTRLPSRPTAVSAPAVPRHAPSSPPCTNADGIWAAPGHIQEGMYRAKFAYNGVEYNDDDQVEAGYLSFGRGDNLNVENGRPQPGWRNSRHAYYVWGNLQGARASGWFPVEAVQVAGP